MSFPSERPDWSSGNDRELFGEAKCSQSRCRRGRAFEGLSGGIHGSPHPPSFPITLSKGCHQTTVGGASTVYDRTVTPSLLRRMVSVEGTRDLEGLQASSASTLWDGTSRKRSLHGAGLGILLHTCGLFSKQRRAGKGSSLIFNLYEV